MARINNEKYTKAFSKHLRETRIKCGMTLDQLGTLSKLDLATVHRIEMSNGNVTLSTMIALAQGLNVHPKELLSFYK